MHIQTYLTQLHTVYRYIHNYTYNTYTYIQYKYIHIQIRTNIPGSYTLDARRTDTLTLHAQVRDMTGTGEVLKRRLKDGQGEFPVDCPLTDTTVRAHYRVRAVRGGVPQVGLWCVCVCVCVRTRAACPLLLPTGLACSLLASGCRNLCSHTSTPPSTVGTTTVGHTTERLDSSPQSTMTRSVALMKPPYSHC